MKDIIKKSFLLGIGITDLTTKTIRKEVESYMKENNINRDEAKKQTDKVIKGIQKNKGKYIKQVRKELAGLEKAIKTQVKIKGKPIAKKVTKKAKATGKKIVKKAKQKIGKDRIVKASVRKK